MSHFKENRNNLTLKRIQNVNVKEYGLLWAALGPTTTRLPHEHALRNNEADNSQNIQAVPLITEVSAAILSLTWLPAPLKKILLPLQALSKEGFSTIIIVECNSIALC